MALQHRPWPEAVVEAAARPFWHVQHQHVCLGWGPTLVDRVSRTVHGKDNNNARWPSENNCAEVHRSRDQPPDVDHPHHKYCEA